MSLVGRLAGPVLIGALGLGCAPGIAPSGGPPPALDVIWVASDMAIVDEMLRLAAIGPGDVLYDLGCGDGRIVVTAAQRHGVRGVGVDLDPVRIREARASAARAGVSHRVTFIEGDLFATDLGAATVVTLYLAPEVNLRLRPKLRRELRPGARIVSHDYDLGDWAPDASAEVALANRVHRLYLWRVPGTRSLSFLRDAALVRSQSPTGRNPYWIGGARQRPEQVGGLSSRGRVPP